MAMARRFDITPLRVVRTRYDLSSHTRKDPSHVCSRFGISR